MTIPQRPLGGTGLQVSVLGYGGAPIGFSGAERHEGFNSLISGALDAGINFFDTAANYRRGEELLGLALHEKRHSVVLATKCGRIQHRDADTWIEADDWSREGVTRSIEASLRHLQTDYLDLVQLHSPPRWVLDDGEALLGLQQAQQSGKVRFIGLSADGPDAMHAVAMGVFATLQVSYSILEQEPEDNLFSAAHSRGMGIIVKQPVANGVPDMIEQPAPPDWWRKWRIAQKLDWAALGAGTECLPFALRWVLANNLISTAIVGTTNQDHLQANIKAAGSEAMDEATRRGACSAYRTACEALDTQPVEQVE